jgi:hypothetical protein
MAVNTNSASESVFDELQSQHRPTQWNHRTADEAVLKKVHCKKRLAIFPPPAGMSTTKLSLVWNKFPARGSLVSDIPTGDGKIANLFLQCTGKKYNSMTYLQYSTY